MIEIPVSRARLINWENFGCETIKKERKKNLEAVGTRVVLNDLDEEEMYTIDEIMYDFLIKCHQP